MVDEVMRGHRAYPHYISHFRDAAPVVILAVILMDDRIDFRCVSEPQTRT